MTNENDQNNLITLTAPAAEAIRNLMNERNLEDCALRIYISGASCAGFQYGMALEKNVRQEDYVSEQYGVRVVVDEISINYLIGATIDFVDDSKVRGFLIQNPNVTIGCKCSSSEGEDSSCSSPCSGCR